jgi:hypothetical protein
MKAAKMTNNIPDLAESYVTDYERDYDSDLPSLEFMLWFFPLFALGGLIFALIVFGVYSVVGAQENENKPVFSCLGLEYSDMAKEYWITYPTIDSTTIDRRATYRWFNRLMNIESSEYAWVDTESYGYFTWPDDVGIYAQVWLNLQDSDKDTPVILLYYSQQTPDVFYALSFHDLIATTDDNGNHLGQHPCAAWVVETSEFQGVWPDLVESLE